MRNSRWVVLHGKAVEEKCGKRLETNTIRRVARYVLINGI